MDKKEKLKRSIIIIIIMVIAIVSIMKSRERRKRIEKEKEQAQEVVKTGNFNTDIIKISYNKANNSNYLISPYNIEIALDMLRVGADGNTKDEIDKVIGNRKINDVSIKDKLNIANGIFIKDIYKNDVKENFTNKLKTDYQAEILYDEYKEPTVINNWVKEKTNGMIDKLLDNMSSDFVLGIASALAIDVKWTNSFECNQTTSEEFTKIDNSKMNTEMMHQTYTKNVQYIKNNEVEGIIIPYATENDKVELEFVGIIPNNVNEYINNLTNDKINNLFTNTKLATDKLHINLSLPRFTYSYEVGDFIKVLEDLGINDAFDPIKANFKKMIELGENVYVGQAIHKTKIELNEKGTKAAAVTYFGMFKNSAMMEKDYDEIDIKFNKPFIYLIREKNTGEILFFGTVFEPNKWEGSTCSNS